MFSEAVDYYAQLGLQTLCLAWRELEEDEYQEWSLMFKDASSSLGMVAEVCQRIEHDLKIIGVAAIEDKLQMHTGDKKETAIQIARSCNFISPGHSSELQAEVKEEFSVKLESLEIDTEVNKSEVAGDVTVTEKSVLDEILATASGGSALRLDGERNATPAMLEEDHKWRSGGFLQKCHPLITNLSGKVNAVLCQFFQAESRRLSPCHFSNSLVLFGCPALQECADNLPIVDPVLSKLVVGRCWVIVPKQHCFAYIVTIELPRQIKGAGVEVEHRQGPVLQFKTGFCSCKDIGTENHLKENF
nr:phospholipid-transporting ATPase 2 [Ipomoea batatas]